MRKGRNTPFLRRVWRGFTLVEIMIVIALIGLLAGLAVPRLFRAYMETRAVAFINDLRLAADAFELYAMEHADYPPDALRGVVPTGMDAYLPKMDWTAPTPLGGRWDWERNTLGMGAGVSVVNPEFEEECFRSVDKKIDDGDLATGRFRLVHGDRYTYIMLR